MSRCTSRKLADHAEVIVIRAVAEHDPQKWKPVFRKDHAPLRYQNANRFNLKRWRSSSQIMPACYRHGGLR